MLKKIRIQIAFIYVALISFLYLFVAILRPFYHNHVYYVGKLIGLGRYIIGVRFKLFNKELLDKHPPCVIISNHQHNIDVFFGGLISPKRTVTIGKRAIFWIPFFGLMYYLTGNILINRKNKKSAFGTMDEAAKEIKRRQLSVWIMAEGTRSQGRGLLPFKKGAFITAIKAEVPIYLVAISEYHKTLNFNKIVSGNVYANVIGPISTTGLTLNDVESLRAKTENIMREEVSKMNQLALENSKKS